MAKTNEAKLLENTTIEYVEDSERGGDPNLVFSMPNPLDEEQPQMRSIRLWTKERGSNQVSEETVQTTEESLRKNLNDESITFAADPKDAEDTDIRHWAKEHKGEQIDNVYQRGQYYQLGLNVGNSASGGSNFLRTYDPNTATEPYDPEQHRMGVFNAQSDDLKTAIRNNDVTHDSVYKKRNGNFGVAFNNHIIHDVVLESANGFKEKTDNTTRVEFLESLLDAFDIVKKKEANKITKKELEEFLEKVKTNPEKHGFKELMRFIGGATAPLLPKQIASIAKDALQSSTRTTIAFYIKNPDTGYIYRTSKLNVNPDITGFEPNFLEYFTGDISRKDIVDFVTNLQIPDFNEVSLQILDTQLNGSIKNLDDPDFGDVPTTVLDFIKALVVNREITLTSNIPADKDFSRMGCYIQSIGDVSIMKSKDIGLEQPTVDKNESFTDTPSNTTSNVESEINQDDMPFPTKEKEDDNNKEDVEEKSSKSNPFEPDEEGEDEKAGFKKSTNPFDI